MSPTQNDVKSNYVKMLNELEKSGGINGLLKKCHPKFEIVETSKGARIQGTLSIGHLDPDLQEFMLKSYASKKNINHEQIKTVDSKDSTIVYFREVSENYLSDDTLKKNAQKHIGQTFFEPLKESKQNLVNYVKGAGFPGSPFAPKPKGSEADSKQENPSFIQRFVDKFKDHAPSLG